MMDAPIIIRKNSREELRISAEEYRGHQLVNLRVWFADEDGGMRPGKQGLALRLELLQELREALATLARGAGNEAR